MFDQPDVSASKYSTPVGGSARDTPLRSARAVMDEGRALTQQLRALPAVDDLAAAWAGFDEIAAHTKARDHRTLGEMEMLLEDRSEFPQAPLQRVHASVMLLSEALGDELRDAWARLRARDLVDVLRGNGKTLRAIHDDIRVSTPYLSQLAN